MFFAFKCDGSDNTISDVLSNIISLGENHFIDSRCFGDLLLLSSLCIYSLVLMDFNEPIVSITATFLDEESGSIIEISKPTTLMTGTPLLVAAALVSPLIRKMLLDYSKQIPFSMTLG